MTFPLPSGEPNAALRTYRDAVAERERSAGLASLRYVLTPASVAVIGASRRPGSAGRVILQNIITGGFPGPVYAVNPGAAELDGVPCVPSAAALPDHVDLAVIAVPAGRARHRRGMRAARRQGAGHDQLRARPPRPRGTAGHLPRPRHAAGRAGLLRRGQHQHHQAGLVRTGWRDRHRQLRRAARRRDAAGIAAGAHGRQGRRGIQYPRRRDPRRRRMRRRGPSITAMPNRSTPRSGSPRPCCWPGCLAVTVRCPVIVSLRARERVCTRWVTHAWWDETLGRSRRVTGGALGCPGR